MNRLIVCALFVGGCTLNAATTVKDAAPAADAPEADAGLGSFGAPARVEELDDPAAADRDPSLTGDLREIFFSSDRAGGAGMTDIWTATRASADAPWGAPVVVAELSSAASDRYPEVSLDGRRIYLTSDRGGGADDLYVATRPGRDQPWEAPVPVAELNSASADRGASSDAGDLALILASARPGGQGAFDLYRSSRAAADDPWDTPEPVTELNTAAGEVSPHLSPDGLTLLFRFGTQGAGDIYRAERPSTGEPFGDKLPVTELNTTEHESGPWMSADRRTVYFWRGTGAGAAIFRAVR